MAQFTLPTGETVLVDDEDFEKISAYSWHIQGPGYVGRTYRENGKMRHEYLHHFLTPALTKVDHKNLNKLDNRKRNLRPASNLQNQANRPKFIGQYSSRFKGVYFNKSQGEWIARIGGGGRQYLGHYPCEIEAAKAYNAAAKEMYGEYALINPV